MENEVWRIEDGGKTVKFETGGWCLEEGDRSLGAAGSRVEDRGWR